MYDTGHGGFVYELAVDVCYIRGGGEKKMKEREILKGLIPVMRGVRCFQEALEI